MTDPDTKVTVRALINIHFELGLDIPKHLLEYVGETHHEAEMEYKLEKIMEDPEKYYENARKKALAEVNREMRDELLSPFKKALDWLLKRR